MATKLHLCDVRKPAVAGGDGKGVRPQLLKSEQALLYEEFAPNHAFLPIQMWHPPGGTMKSLAKLSAIAVLAITSATIAYADNLTFGSYGSTQAAGNTVVPVTAGNSNTVTLYTGGPAPYQAPAATVNLSPYNAAHTPVWYVPPTGANWSWVSFNTSAPYNATGPGGTVVPNSSTTPYVFTTTFNVLDPNAATDMAGVLNLLADDTMTVLLNGIVVASGATPVISSSNPYDHCSATGISCLAPTLVNLSVGDFVTGLNTFTFDVYQVNNFSMGFAAYGSASPVPEPNTMLLLGTGLLGMAGVLFARKGQLLF